MTKKQAEKRIEKLKELINHHRYLYHTLDKPEISDSAFDTLKNELEELERKFPDLITPDSPTQRVGGEALEKFEKVSHGSPMLSLNDAFGEKEFKEWVERVLRLSSGQVKKIDYFCELKLDGLAVSLIYEKGVFVRGATRGDGKIGEDVTQNLKTISSIPLRLNLTRPGLVKSEIEVRGEVIMTKKTLSELNKKYEKEGKPMLANPRNAAAGSIRQLDPKITAGRRLDFFAYAMITDMGQKRHSKGLKMAKDLGFKIVDENKFCKNVNEVIDFHHKWEEKRDKMPFNFDGIVVKVDRLDLHEMLGTVGKAPRWAIAYKFSPEEAITILKDIKIQVGRTGVLTPVAVLKPVEIGGVIVCRATLHNKDEIKRLGLKIGDTVVVGRAGDVIPDVRRVVRELRDGKEKNFKMLKKCPVCKSNVLKEEILIRCINKKCPSRQKKRIYYFVSRPAFNIEGLGPKIIDALLDQGLVQDASELFELKEGDLVPLERFADKSAENLVRAISQAKKITLPRFIIALGIEHVGSETAQVLAEKFGSLKKLKNASVEELENIPDIGSIVAKSIYDWFRDDYNKKFLGKLLRHIDISQTKKPKSQETNKILIGKKFVLTGVLESMKRDEAKQKIRELGGRVADSVSRETDFVVVGENPGSKLKNAQKIGIKILTENDFLKFLD